MKYILITIFSFTAAITLPAQNLYFNIGVGSMNYGGDLQQKDITFNQAGGAFSLGLSYRFSDHFSVSSAYTFGVIKANDKLNPNRNSLRNLNFKSNINEGNILVEAQLKSVPGTAKFTPYLFGGLAVFHFNPYTYDTAGIKAFLQPLRTEGQGLAAYPDRKIYNLTQFAIPFGVGLRYALSENILVSGELGFRKLFTDYLDDASRTYADTALLRAANGALSAELSYRGDELKPPEPFSTDSKRGNPNHNDSYYTFLLKLSFSINTRNSSGSGISRRIQKQTECPRKVM